MSTAPAAHRTGRLGEAFEHVAGIATGGGRARQGGRPDLDERPAEYGPTPRRTARSRTARPASRRPSRLSRRAGPSRCSPGNSPLCARAKPATAGLEPELFDGEHPFGSDRAPARTEAAKAALGEHPQVIVGHTATDDEAASAGIAFSAVATGAATRPTKCGRPGRWWFSTTVSPAGSSFSRSEGLGSLAPRPVSAPTSRASADRPAHRLED